MYHYSVCCIFPGSFCHITDFVLSWNIVFKVCVCLFVFTTRPHLWKISATYPPSRGGRGCSRGSTNSAKSSRKRWIRGRASPTTRVYTGSFLAAFFTCPARRLASSLMELTLAAEHQEKTVFGQNCCRKMTMESMSQLKFVCFRDALNKMKDVYEKNPQMGDPSSLQPKISETICNMEKLRSEIHKNEV